MYTEFVILQNMHNDAELKLVADNFKYHHFRCGWYEFIRLLDIDYTKGFCCGQCGRFPDSIIMDGTAIAFRQALDSWKSFIGTPSPPHKNSGR